MKVKKTTPILCVESIEKSLPLWVDTLGYSKIVEVPHEGKLGFVILKKDGSEIMMQTEASIKADIAQAADFIKPGDVWLYSDIDSIEELQKRLKTVEVLVPLRRTFYGAQEIFVRDSNGQVLGFAEHAEQDHG